MTDPQDQSSNETNPGEMPPQSSTSRGAHSSSAAGDEVSKHTKKWLLSEDHHAIGPWVIAILLFVFSLLVWLISHLWRLLSHLPHLPPGPIA